MGIAAKAEARMRSEDLPRMREKGNQVPANRQETKEQHSERLRTTALGLPRAVVEGAVGNMHDRVRKVVAAKGGLLLECRGPQVCATTAAGGLAIW